MGLLRQTKGQSLVELLVALGLAAVMLPALLTGVISSREGKAQQPRRLGAGARLREGIEAVRSVRKRGWTSFAINGVYHPVVSQGVWMLVSGVETTADDFARSITISDVARDSNGDVVATGGTVDPSTKQVLVTVSWDNPVPAETSSILYVTRYLDNLLFTHTTQADFAAGTKSGVVVTNTAGGEVTLASGGHGNWCDPNLSIAALDLPKSGVANALTAIEGQAFAGTGDNASGVSFARVAISNTNPPNSSVVGTVDGYKTNGVFGETGYAYLATDTNAKEVVIINTTSHTEVGHFNAPGNGTGNSVFSLANVGFITNGSKLYTFDLSAKTGARPQLGSVDLAGVGNKVVVSGTYAYVATASTSNQLQIIDVSNPSSMAVVGSASLPGLGATDVFVNATASRAYITTGQSPSQKELFIVDITTKTGGHTAMGSYDTAGMNPKGVTGVSGNKIIAVGTNAEEYQVIDVTSESIPVRCGGLNIDAGVNGVSAVLEADGDAYSYIITGDSGAEFKIIEGGPGGQYSNSGTFESAVFNPGYATAYNYLTFSGSAPASTEMTMQVAVSTDCNSFVFVGPDGTSSTFYTLPGGAIAIGQGSGQCLKYKLFLSSTDPAAAPILTDVSVNYSP